MSTPPHLSSPRLHRSPPELVDDLIAEILLRLPPRKPERLIRCSAVCKSWRLLLTDPAFLRRYREFHGVAPMLGVLFNLDLPRIRFVWRFVPTTPFRPRTLEQGRCFVRDARHGRVLLRDLTFEDDNELFVWNPVTDERWGLPLPVVPYWWGWGWNATVLCAAAVCQGGGGSGECDHLNCHRGPFLVAFMGTNEDGATCACVYSSETAGWSDPTYAEHPDGIAEFDMQPSTLVGSMVYFLAKDSMTIVEYDWRRKLAFVDPPFQYHGRGVLMPAMGGGLGFAGVRESCLYL
ncbi:hypothetical protein BS78_01G180800 [Paspalum vaginatum]|nr:hypothetical protein BS78_01G180800 [Paspalum vaginatum]